MRQRRKYLRASFQTEVWLGQDGIYTRTSEMLRDLSEGGAFIETLQRFPIGSIIYLRFNLPGSGKLISCTVEVRNVWKDASGFGVQFLDISPDSAQQIRLYVEETSEFQGPRNSEVRIPGCRSWELVENK